MLLNLIVINFNDLFDSFNVINDLLYSSQIYHMKIARDISYVLNPTRVFFEDNKHNGKQKIENRK
jgi:hypothetical protein